MLTPPLNQMLLKILHINPASQSLASARAKPQNACRRASDWTGMQGRDCALTYSAIHARTKGVSLVSVVECSWENPLSIEAKSPQPTAHTPTPQNAKQIPDQNNAQNKRHIAERFSAGVQNVDLLCRREGPISGTLKNWPHNANPIARLDTLSKNGIGNSLQLGASNPKVLQLRSCFYHLHVRLDSRAYSRVIIVSGRSVSSVCFDGFSNKFR